MTTTNYRSLTNNETEELLGNNNSSDNWDNFFVTGNFNTSLIKNCQFRGKIYLGDLTPKLLSCSNISLPVGIYNSFLDSVHTGNQVAIHNAKYIANYKIGDQTLIFNIGDLASSENAKFGNGTWIDVSNGNSGRKILSFSGMREADALLWSKFRDDKELQNKLENLTNDVQDQESIGIIANNCIIKNVKSIEDCIIGPYAIIDGASRLRNVTIQSNFEEPSSIGDDVEINNAIIGFGNQVTSGSKCTDIITGRNVGIKLGARVLKTFVGSNSAIACCEISNNLLFPFHSQHHNNSFLIASTIMGQSNIAAGATIGSNHNSREADGEILAKRGFWPGLNTSFKHNSVFASFTLIAKASFEIELNIQLPFSLISKDSHGSVQLFPAFWFRYNMYALARNTWKFKNRDNRKVKEQHIEYDYLAPDTAWEILNSIDILKDAVKKASTKTNEVDEKSFNNINDLKDIYLEGVVPKEKTLVIKPLQAIWLYKNMISLFAANEIVKFLKDHVWEDLNKIIQDISTPQPWINFGGQLIEGSKSLELIEDIKSEKLKSWDDIHQRYDSLWKQYKNDKLKYALDCWAKKDKKNNVTREDIISLLKHAANFSEHLVTWAVESREKDYTNPFRKMNYQTEEEMNAVIGDINNNIFIKEMENESELFRSRIMSILTKIEKRD